MSSLVVFVTAPTDEAGALARRLVDRRVAACANILPNVRSVYRWQGAVEEASECLLVLKTTSAGFEALRDAVLEFHSYEVPEVLAVEAARVNEAYARWIAGEVGGSA
ncbi:MAG: divalent-cation tolerance protein CutA [Myxococcales bacterium]|nr:divalent-cation tolerance protein CutA [Myxococcales bacterium]